jgi:integrator complex subunit 6
MLMQCIDSLVQKVQSGVVINFEKMGPDPLPVTSEGKRTILGIICWCFLPSVLLYIVY